MAFPSIRSSATTNGTTATATPSVNLPATIRAGDTLVVYFRSAVAGAVGFPANWNALVDASPDAADDQIAIAWKKADGTEGATLALTSGNGKFAAIARSIQDAADPLIRAPEISTVAVGTTGEPNATTCTPTGGAKDYLWDTVFLMEGEQTGITANPSGYTLGQQFANSGTAGAVTTNCTIGAVARTNNAASEDAGAWDVAGTLDDSAAYTVAFHPADVIPTPLAPDYEWPVVPAPRRTSTIAALTIAVNLLQSTLNPVVAAPFSQQHWPNPPTAQRIVTSIETLPTEDAERAFAQHAWPNPRLKPPAAQTWLVTLLQSTLAPVEEPRPFVQTDWAGPSRRRETPPTWVQSLLTTTLAPVDEASPFTSAEWALPRRTPPAVLTWVQPRPVLSVEPLPFAQADWPLPVRQKGTALGWLQTRPVFAIDETPAAQRDWPLPVRFRPTAQTWLVNLQQSTLAQPFAQREWPLPTRAKTTALSWLQTRPTFAVDASLTPIDWPNPRRALVAALTHLQARPFFYAEPGALPPGQQAASELPLEGRAHAVGWLQSRPAFAVDAGILRQSDWPLPRVATKPALTWTQGRPFFYAEPGSLPPGVSIANVNPLIGRRNAVGWTQGRPTFAVDTKIDRQSDWPLPRVAVKPALTWLQSALALVTPPEQPPVNRQNDWPLPVRARAIALSWIQTRQALHVDTGIPRAFDLSLPVRARPLPPTWTSSTLALDVPLRPAAWSVPPPAPRPALTWTGNLLESTLAGAPPIAAEFILPRLRPAPALTWLQTRPSYYQDEQPCAQHDWPLPLRPVVPALTWRWSVIESTLAITPIDLGCTDVVSLMPRRTVEASGPVRDVVSLMPRRTAVCPCCGG